MIFSRLHTFDDFQVLARVDMEFGKANDIPGVAIVVETFFGDPENETNNTTGLVQSGAAVESFEQAQDFFSNFDSKTALSYRRSIEQAYYAAREEFRQDMEMEGGDDGD